MLAFGVTACGRDPDARLQKQIVGTWALTSLDSYGGGLTNTVTVARDGRYDCRIVSGSGRLFYVQGLFQVQQGFLVDTMTNSSNTNAPLPEVFRARIIRVDDHEMLLLREKLKGWFYPTNEPLWRKVSR